MRNKKGFTLFELLVVVVILAILAAFILPRFLSQADRAIAGEAIQMLGAIRRAQITYSDSTGGLAYLDAGASDTESDGNAAWKTIGLGDISSQTKFSYSCNGTAGTCTATRIVGGTETVTIGIDNGVLTCGNGWMNVTSNQRTVGCIRNPDFDDSEESDTE